MTKKPPPRSRAAVKELAAEVLPARGESVDLKKKELWVMDKKSKMKNETWFVNKECSKPEAGSDGEED